ncbi:XTP/dITP diphosphohydrolase [Actinosynnema pretiosum]|nr:XTP/dITP diphosphohydrolase [Actinosynnema pretiosum]
MTSDVPPATAPTGPGAAVPGAVGSNAAPPVTVIVVSARLGWAVPLAELSALRAAPVVCASAGVPLQEGVRPAPGSASELDAGSVLLTSDPAEPLAAELVARGARLVRAPEPPIVEAVAVMDRLRSPGGCPWDAEQDHDSLRKYLVEETYELLEAIEDGDRDAMREELGDVLLQVLFHARVAAEHPERPFGVDEVAADLVAKLVGRHPHVFAGGDPAVRDASTQEHRWEELKQQEKKRESSVDGVALGQPAAALAAKLVQRAARAGWPADLVPDGDDTGTTLFGVAALAKLAGEDPEAELRAVARAFEKSVRQTELAARAAGRTTLTAQDWREFWTT